MQNQIINLCKTREPIKQYPKTARRMRGNTLVPVVIGLLIAAIATVAFLNQGESLREENNRTLAVNEIISIIGKYKLLRAQGTKHSEINTLEKFSLKGGQVNAYGRKWVLDDVKTEKEVHYKTTSVKACTNLKPMINGKYNVTAACSQLDDTKENLIITFK